jgi:hypothetical protein
VVAYKMIIEEILNNLEIQVLISTTCFYLICSAIAKLAKALVPQETTIKEIKEVKKKNDSSS